MTLNDFVNDKKTVARALKNLITTILIGDNVWLSCYYKDVHVNETDDVHDYEWRVGPASGIIKLENYGDEQRNIMEGIYTYHTGFGSEYKPSNILKACEYLRKIIDDELVAVAQVEEIKRNNDKRGKVG